MKEEDILWVRETLEKINTKLQKTAERSFNKLPYTACNNVHDNMLQKDVTWWTNGFWPGLMWMMFAATNNMVYKTAAENTEELLDAAFSNYDGLHHDVGFMWNISSGVHYRINKDKKAYTRMMLAANILAGRYQLKGGYIRAWNDGIETEINRGWSIIDCMMNIPLLYHASKLSNDPRFAEIAMAHADKTLKYHLRKDGSVRHIVEYNPDNGDYIKCYQGQGYGPNSSWSRGQAWALYGFALSYTYTKKQNYLDAAKSVAHYFIANLQPNKLPLCDFRSHDSPVIYDSTAGAIAACGLLEIAKNVEDKKIYETAALNILRTLSNYCDFDVDTDQLLLMGTERYHSEKGRHIPIIYGDYFFAEAFVKIINPSFLAW